jgi:hypothetical protein
MDEQDGQDNQDFLFRLYILSILPIHVTKGLEAVNFWLPQSVLSR